VNVFNRGDERMIYNVIYRDGKNGYYYAKRFPITSITRDKEYDITQSKEGSRIEYFSANPNGEAETVRINLRPKAKLKKTSLEYDFAALAIKSKGVRGNLVTKNPVRNISLKAKGVSTIAGKDIWYDPDIQKLNDEERGQYLGQFDTEDKVLAVFKNGTFYTTSFDLVNKYQGDVLLVQKFDPEKTFTALYYDGNAKNFYVKRFSFILSDNTPLPFISNGSKSYLVALSEDEYPQYKVIFGGKNSEREPEIIAAEEWIGKKGYQAKGKKCHDRYKVKKVMFVEPLQKTEEDEPVEGKEQPKGEKQPESQKPIEVIEIIEDIPVVPETSAEPEKKEASETKAESDTKAETEASAKPTKEPGKEPVKDKAPAKKEVIEIIIEEPTLF
jgi:topoisomerase-4 subunit A